MPDPYVDCECPITGINFYWHSPVSSDQIIVCLCCGKDHVIGDIGDRLWYDPEEGWKVDTAWKGTNLIPADKNGPLFTTLEGTDNRNERLTANDRQPGGTHYRDAGEIQHWDVISQYNVGYLEGCATKYLSRWRKKGGLLDLEKAAHYTDKLIEMVETGKREIGGKVPHEIIVQFSFAYDLWSTDDTACCFLLMWTKSYQLKLARDAIDHTIARAKAEGWGDTF